MKRSKLFKLIASILATLSTVLTGALLFPLAWMIPMTIKLWKAFKKDSDVSPERSVTTAIFVNQIAGALLFADNVIRAPKGQKVMMAAYMFGLCCVISVIPYLLPLLWFIPMFKTLKAAYLNDRRLSVAFKICTLIFVSTPLGILLFFAKSVDENGNLKELQTHKRTKREKKTYEYKPVEQYVPADPSVAAIYNEKHSTSRLISKRRHVSLPQWATAWIVLIPAMIFLVFFMFYPIVNTFFMAFINDFAWKQGGGSFALGSFFSSISRVSLIGTVDPIKGQFVPESILSFGFDNFLKLFQGYAGEMFVNSIFNTVILVIVEVPLTIIISLLLATFLHSIKALKGLFQTIFFLPYVTNAIALGMVFQMLFATGQGGLINLVLGVFGVGPVNWLNHGQPGYNHWISGIVIVVYSVWTGLAFKILVFMSGLATIDKQYSDAAKIDGANSVTIWRRITIPLLSPQILYITITSFIGAFKMYSGVMSVFSSYKGNETHFFGGNTEGTDWMPVVGWIYKAMEKPTFGGQGVAAAGSLVLLGIILVVTAIQGVVSKKRVHY